MAANGSEFALLCHCNPLSASCVLHLRAPPPLELRFHPVSRGDWLSLSPSSSFHQFFFSTSIYIFPSIDPYLERWTVLLSIEINYSRLGTMVVVREINTFLFCYQSAFNFEWNVRGGKSLLIPMKLIIVINSSWRWISLSRLKRLIHTIVVKDIKNCEGRNFSRHAFMINKYRWEGSIGIRNLTSSREFSRAGRRDKL